MTTPLCFACEKIDDVDVLKEIVNTLLKFGANPNIADKKYVTPLIHVIKRRIPEDIYCLLYSSPYDYTKYLSSLNAYLSKCLGVVGTLLRSGADLELRDQNGFTALMHAVECCNEGVVKMLLTLGANAKISDNRGTTPLMKCGGESYTNIVKMLIESGADVNSKDKLGLTALIYNIAGEETVVKMLLDAGAKIDDEVLFSAIENTAPENLKVLLEFGANVNTMDANKETILMRACICDAGSQEMIKILLQYGAKINSVNKQGQTALMFAASNNMSGAINLLLKAGANINFCDKKGDIALIYARRAKCTKNIETLLKAGAK